jgi:hypothetical protein
MIGNVWGGAKTGTRTTRIRNPQRIRLWIRAARQTENTASCAAVPGISICGSFGCPAGSGSVPAAATVTPDATVCGKELSPSAVKQTQMIPRRSLII